MKILYDTECTKNCSNHFFYKYLFRILPKQILVNRYVLKHLGFFSIVRCIILTIFYKKIKSGNNSFRTTCEMKWICSRVEQISLKLCWRKRPNSWTWYRNRWTCSSNICCQLTSSTRSKPSWLNLWEEGWMAAEDAGKMAMVPVTMVS